MEFPDWVQVKEKNTIVVRVCDESMTSGMIMCHTITNNFSDRAIRYQLYQSCQGDFMLYS